MPTKIDQLSRRFVQLVSDLDPSISQVEIVIHRQVLTETCETISLGRPEKAPEAPTTAPEPEPAPTPTPEPEAASRGDEGPDRAPRERCLPDASKRTKGIRYSDEEIARVKMLINRGVRPVEIARRTGLSIQHVVCIKKGRTRRSVQAAPDPREV